MFLCSYSLSNGDFRATPVPVNKLETRVEVVKRQLENRRKAQQVDDTATFSQRLSMWKKIAETGSIRKTAQADD